MDILSRINKTVTVDYKVNISRPVGIDVDGEPGEGLVGVGEDVDGELAVEPVGIDVDGEPREGLAGPAKTSRL